MPLTGGRKPRWGIYEEEPINPGDLVNIAPWSPTKTIPYLEQSFGCKKGFFYVKEWISGPVAVWSNKWHRMDLVWYLPGLFFQNSHTQSFPQKRSSATATSTSEALKCLSSDLRAPLMAQHSLEGISGKNLPWLLLTCYLSMTLSHDWATCKRFSHLSLFSRGTLDH